MILRHSRLIFGIFHVLQLKDSRGLSGSCKSLRMRQQGKGARLSYLGVCVWMCMCTHECMWAHVHRCLYVGTKDVANTTFSQKFTNSRILHQHLITMSVNILQHMFMGNLRCIHLHLLFIYWFWGCFSSLSKRISYTVDIPCYLKFLVLDCEWWGRYTFFYVASLLWLDLFLNIFGVVVLGTGEFNFWLHWGFSL